MPVRSNHPQQAKLWSAWTIRQWPAKIPHSRLISSPYNDKWGGRDKTVLKGANILFCNPGSGQRERGDECSPLKIAVFFMAISTIGLEIGSF
jgi:hypothetical protein